jgi:DNA-binding NarL/FixJ family response regulator
VLRSLASEDMTIDALAQELSISPITAHQHITAIRRAFKVKTNIAAVIRGIKLGLVDIK